MTKRGYLILTGVVFFMLLTLVLRNYFFIRQQDHGYSKLLERSFTNMEALQKATINSALGMQYCLSFAESNSPSRLKSNMLALDSLKQSNDFQFGLLYQEAGDSSERKLFIDLYRERLRMIQLRHQLIVFTNEHGHEKATEFYWKSLVPQYQLLLKLTNAYTNLVIANAKEHNNELTMQADEVKGLNHYLMAAPLILLIFFGVIFIVLLLVMNRLFGDSDGSF